MSASYYLQTVLGVESFIRESTSHHQSHDQSNDQSDEQLYDQTVVKFWVYTPFDPSEVEKELVGKILSSIGVSEAEFINQNEWTAKINSKGTVVERHFGISFGISPPKQINATWLELPAVSRFISESDKEKVNEIKRSAWSQLKILKSKMDSR